MDIILVVYVGTPVNSMLEQSIEFLPLRFRYSDLKQLLLKAYIS